MSTKAKVGLGLLLASLAAPGLAAVGGAGAEGIANAAPPVVQGAGTTQPVAAAAAPSAKPEIVGFRRVVQGSGAVASLALTDGPLYYRIDIKNPSNAQISKQVVVKRMPGTAESAVVAGIMADVPKGDTRSFGFSDAMSIADGCNPTRYLITIEDGSPRVGRVKPSCTFSFTKIAGSSGPQGNLAANPACNQPWGLSATVGMADPIPAPPGMPSFPSLLALRSVHNNAQVIASVSVPPGAVTATLTDPFRGLPGSFGLTLSKSSGPAPLGSTPPPPSTNGAWRVGVSRTCTVDLGALE